MLVDRILLGAVLTLSMAAAARGENWPQFRGPAENGIPSESRLPTAWGPDNHIAWSVEIPGKAWSQPVVWGDRIYVTTAIPQPPATPAAAPATEPAAGAGGGQASGEGGGDDASATKPAEAAAPAAAPATEPAPSEAAPQDTPAEGDYPRRRGGGRGRGGFGFGGETPDQVYRWEVMCLDRATGKAIWQPLAHEGKTTLPIHRTNT